MRRTRRPAEADDEDDEDRALDRLVSAEIDTLLDGMDRLGARARTLQRRGKSAPDVSGPARPRPPEGPAGRSPTVLRAYPERDPKPARRSPRPAEVIGLDAKRGPREDGLIDAAEADFIAESVAWLRRRPNADLVLEEIWRGAVEADPDDDLDMGDEVFGFDDDATDDAAHTVPETEDAATGGSLSEAFEQEAFDDAVFPDEDEDGETDPDKIRRGRPPSQFPSRWRRMNVRVPLGLDHIADRADYAVIGPVDDRQQVLDTCVAPFRAICRVERDYGTGRFIGCTGFLVAPDLVLTAGHCVFSHLRGRAPSRIRVAPGRDGTVAPFGVRYARSWHAHPDFVRRLAPSHDFGLIRLGRPFAGLGHEFRPDAPDASALARVRRSRLLRIAGYPSDKPRTMWSHAERLDAASGGLLHYSVDTCPGHSGAPVWISGSSPARVIGIHTRGPHPHRGGVWGCKPGVPLAPTGYRNSGVRITPALLADFVAIRTGQAGRLLTVAVANAGGA